MNRPAGGPMRVLLVVLLGGAALLCGGVLVACFSATALRGADRIAFPADAHADLLEDCSLCHLAVMEDVVLVEARRAHEDTCLECHRNMEGSCAACHEGMPGERPDKDHKLIFSHRDHLRRVGGDCTRCHTAAAAGDPHPTGQPGHPQCFQCHPMRRLFDELECRRCHEDLAERRLLPLESFRHTPDWVREHGELLQRPDDEQRCAQCHDDSFCSDCHFEDRFMRLSEVRGEDVSVRFIHPGDFLHRHQMEARTEPERCLTCHSQTTCLECHQRNGVALPEAGVRSDGFRFHAAGISDPASLEFHGRSARRDILACAGCHDSGLDALCVQCHQEGGVGGNPHPPGFRSSLSRTGDRVCKACHRK